MAAALGRVLTRKRRRSVAATGVALVVAAFAWVVVRPVLQEQPVVGPLPKIGPRLPAAGRVAATIRVGESPLT